MPARGHHRLDAGAAAAGRCLHARGVPVLQVYGSTETCPIAVYTRLGGDLPAPARPACPACCARRAIVDDAGREVPPGTAGEVVVRGPNVLFEYWGNAEATARGAARRLVPHRRHRHARRATGISIIHDRKKNMIISGGENIYPAEVERVLHEHPAVAEAAVIGRADPKWQEVPVAYIVRRAGMRDRRRADRCASASAQLARFKVPREYRVRGRAAAQRARQGAAFPAEGAARRQVIAGCQLTEMTMRIAVLGGGNGSFAAAGDLALAGHDVRLWRRDRAAVAAHRAAGGTITVKDFRGRHEAKLSLVTNDIAEAVRGAELILCPAPATAQPDIATRARAASGRRTGRVPAARHLRLDAVRQGRARCRQPRRGRLCRDRHAALAHAQARAVRGRDHHPRQAAADRRVSADPEGPCARASSAAPFPA